MTFPAGNAQTQSSFDSLVQATLTIRSYGLQIVAATNGGGSVSAQIVLNIATWCVNLIATVNTVSANAPLVTALVPYFQQQLNAPTFNASTEFPILVTLAQNILNAVGAEYPHDAQGHLLDRTFSFTLGPVWITATAAQMPLTMTAVNAYLAEIVGG